MSIFPNYLIMQLQFFFAGISTGETNCCIVEVTSKRHPGPKRALPLRGRDVQMQYVLPTTQRRCRRGHKQCQPPGRQTAALVVATRAASRQSSGRSPAPLRAECWAWTEPSPTGTDDSHHGVPRAQRELWGCFCAANGCTHGGSWHLPIHFRCERARSSASGADLGCRHGNVCCARAGDRSCN